jgi:hypothetical protein
MDAWREGDQFIVELDLPGVRADSLSLDVERNVLTVRAERSGLDQNRKMVAAERPRGVFSRQVFLGDTLDTTKIEASYEAGVLRLCGASPSGPSRGASRSTVSTRSSRSTLTVGGSLARGQRSTHR